MRIDLGCTGRKDLVDHILVEEDIVEEEHGCKLQLEVVQLDHCTVVVEADNSPDRTPY